MTEGRVVLDWSRDGKDEYGIKKVGLVDSLIVTGVIGGNVTFYGRNDHTIMTAPLPVCSAKLSMIWSS